MKYSKYLNIEKNEKHVINLINWLLDEVHSACGDGDGIWYSQIYSIEDIQQFIIDNDLLPERWTMKIYVYEGMPMLNLIYDQEGLTITNNKELFDNKPSWQQVSLDW